MLRKLCPRARCQGSSACHTRSPQPRTWPSLSDSETPSGTVPSSQRRGFPGRDRGSLEMKKDYVKFFLNSLKSEGFICSHRWPVLIQGMLASPPNSHIQRTRGQTLRELRIERLEGWGARTSTHIITETPSHLVLHSPAKTHLQGMASVDSYSGVQVYQSLWFLPIGLPFLRAEIVSDVRS